MAKKRRQTAKAEVANPGDVVTVRGVLATVIGFRVDGRGHDRPRRMLLVQPGEVPLSEAYAGHAEWIDGGVYER